MNEHKARGFLGKYIQPDNSLSGLSGRWKPYMGLDIVLDSEFTADELEALAWWVRNKHELRKKSLY